MYEYHKEVNAIEKMIKIREKYNLFSTKYEYGNEGDVITLKNKDIKVVINMANKVVKVEKKDLLFSTDKEQLNKYDLAIYKNKG